MLEASCATLFLLCLEGREAALQVVLEVLACLLQVRLHVSLRVPLLELIQLPQALLRVLLQSNLLEDLQQLVVRRLVQPLRLT